MASPSDDRTHGGSPEPEPRSALRSLAAYAAVLVGAALLAVGWYGISGTAVVAEQLPYLASASLPGVALVIGGAVLVAGDRTRRSETRSAEMVATLYRLLTEAVEAPGGAGAPAAGDTAGGTASPPSRNGAVVAVAGATRFHRPDCALVRGKEDAAAVGTDEIAARQLQPCPICDPAPPG